MPDQPADPAPPFISRGQKRPNRVEEIIRKIRANAALIEAPEKIKLEVHCGVKDVSLHVVDLALE